MSLPCKAERSQLRHDEFDMVRLTHHPAIYHIAPNDLRALKLVCGGSATRRGR
jgi:hypothetical protein